MVRISDHALVIFNLVLQVFFIGLATYLYRYTQEYSLPVSSTLFTFIITLTALSPVLYGGVLFLSQQGECFGISSKFSHPATLMAMFIAFTIYETVMATLGGTLIAPESGLKCDLDRRWLTLFRQKDSSAIRKIQDAFDCCGLRTVVDRAWPFPADGVTADACRTSFGRTKSCLEPWKRQEQFIGQAIVLIAVLMFLGQFIFLRNLWRQPSWLSRYAERTLTGRRDEERRIHAPLNYRSIEENRPLVVGSELYDADSPNWSNPQQSD